MPRSAGSALLAALVLRRPELAALAAPFLLLLALGLLTAGEPDLRTSGDARPQPRARGRDGRLEVELRGRADDRARRGARWSCRPGVVADCANPAAVRVSALDRARARRCRLRGRALGRPLARRTDAARPRLARPLQPHGPRRRGRRRQGLSAARGVAQPAPPRRDAALLRRRALAAEGRRHRVRRPPPVRLRRPHAPDQLARERAARRAVGERAAPGAEHGRRPLPRQLRRRPARRARRRSTSPSGRRRRSPGDTSGDATGSGSSRFGGYVRWLAPGSGMAQALPHRRRAARHGDHAQLRLEGDRHRPGRARCRRRRS